jgi:phage terminase large subunit GpA-like protein
LTAEKAVTKFVKGFPRLEWHKTSGARNEPLDCRVYAFAALVLRAPQFDKLALRRRQTMPTPKPAEVEMPPPVELPAEDTPPPHEDTAGKRRRTQRRGSFVNSW